MEINPKEKEQKEKFCASPPIVVEDKLYKLDHFLIPNYMKEYLEGVLIPEGLIKSRIERIAFDIVHFYRGVPFTMVPLLKGSSRVFEELSTLLRTYVEIGCYNFDLMYDFVRAKSYFD